MCVCARASAYGVRVRCSSAEPYGRRHLRLQEVQLPPSPASPFLSLAGLYVVVGNNVISLRSVHVALQGSPGRFCHHFLSSFLLTHPLAQPRAIHYHGKSPSGKPEAASGQRRGGSLGSYDPVSHLGQTEHQLAFAGSPR